jgi:AbrB family looped-hinge helix DNA binding protein
VETTRISSKGQIVVPKSVRDELDWAAGTELTVERCEQDAVVLRRKTVIRPTTVDEVAGMLKYEGPPVTLEDMQRAIDEELLDRWRRKSG